MNFPYLIKCIIRTLWRRHGKSLFACVAKYDSLASEILRLMIFLDRSRIKRTLFTSGKGVLTDDWKLSEATIVND